VTDDYCRVPGHVHSDAAKRASDAGNQAWADGGYDGTVGKFMAFRLDNGSSDGTCYPTKQEACRFNSEYEHFFIAMHPGGLGACEAEIMLKFHRTAYDAGFPIISPDGKKAPELIPRIGRAEITAQIQGILSRKGK
jgi:hypothetical protein